MRVRLPSQILLMAMKDMNIAKLTSADLPLFNGITQDLFPAVETPIIDYGKVGQARREKQSKQTGLQVDLNADLTGTVMRISLVWIKDPRA